LKGAVANFTDGPALQAAKALEMTGKRNDLPAARAAIVQLASELERLRVALSAFTSRQQGIMAKGQGAS
jgi:hypothetical protein